MKEYSLKLPKAVYSGNNSLDKIPEIISAAKVKKVAAFTDQSLRKLGLFNLVEEELKRPALIMLYLIIYQLNQVIFKFKK